MRVLLAVPEGSVLVLERYSDSAGSYVVLDSNNLSIYKQLYRAAKAKLKLRLKATVLPAKPAKVSFDLLDDKMAEIEKMKPAEMKLEPRSTYLETVLSHPVGTGKPVPTYKNFQNADRPFEKTQGQAGAYVMPGAFTTTEPLADPQPRPSPQSTKFSQPTVPCFRDFSGTFSIDCNHCGMAVPNEHYHCGTCEKGDFDLCQACVENGVTCYGEDHWLIKRFIRNGMIIPSVTETSAPRMKKVDAMIEIPAAVDFEERTCNSCINRKVPRHVGNHTG